MSQDKIERVKSSSSGVVGRAQSLARSARLLLDSSSRRLSRDKKDDGRGGICRLFETGQNGTVVGCL